MAEELALDKEGFDALVCIVTPRLGSLGIVKEKHCRSVMQPSDLRDNEFGRTCPDNVPCEQRCRHLFGLPDPEGGPFTGYPWDDSAK